MGTLRQQIAQKFLEALTQSQAIDSEKIEQLRDLLTNKKPKPEDFVKIFSQPPGGTELK